MQFLLLVVVFFLGFYAGWKFRALYTALITKHYMENVQKQIEQQIKNDYVYVTIEKHNDMFFVYDQTTNRFIVQAKDRDTLESELQKIFPGKRFACTPENLKEIGFTL
jgi:hypothetical protein